MAVCEKCGKRFEPAKNVEVVTTRVLCAPCTAERAAEKLRAKAMAGGGAAPVPELPAGTRSQPKRESPTPPPPQGARRKPVEDDEEKTSGRHALGGGSEQRASKTTMFAWVFAGVFLIGSALVVYVIAKKKQDENRHIEAILAEQKGVFDNLTKLSASGTEVDAQTLIQFAESQAKIWQASENAAEVTNLIAKAKNLIDRERLRKETLKTMETVEAGLAGAEARQPSEIAELRRNLDMIEPRAEGIGAEFVARVGVARTKLDRAYGSALHEDAKSYLAANADKGRLALQRYTTAEDEINKLYDEAIKAKNRESQDFFQGHYKEIISESDKLVEECYPADSLDKLPWKDLLSGEQVERWNGQEVKGFSHRLEGGIMTMIGPDPDAHVQGLISIGDREQWRDFVMDLEFTLESGQFELYFRLGKSVKSDITKLAIEAGPDGLVPGKTYVITAKMIGSTLSVTYYPEDLTLEPVPLSWTKTRKGGIGFLLNEGARLKITRLRVQELRKSGK